MTNTTKKFTKRDMFEAIAVAFTGEEVPADKEMPTPDEIVEFCNAQLAVLETAKQRKAEKRNEPDALRDMVYATLATATEAMTAAEVVIALDNEEYTMGKISNRLSALVRDGLVYKTQASIKDAEGKVAKRMVYSISPFEK